MVEREVEVTPENGLHGRPGARFVSEARRYEARITVTKGDREADASSIMKLMALGAKKGDSVVIQGEGEDAEQAVEALAVLISGAENSE